MTREAFNLSALQEELKKHPEYKDIQKRIGRFLAARSCRMDLLGVRSSLAELAKLNDASASDRMGLGQPLMLHAVILYYRATVEDGNGRFKIGAAKNFSAEQIKKHQDVVKLRHKSMAHYGIGEGAYGEAWITELVVMRGVNNVANIMEVWQRSNYIARLVFDLDELSENALARVEEVGEAEHKELSELFFKTLGRDGKFVDLMMKHPFEPAAFYSSQEGVDSFWSGGNRTHETYTPKVTSADFSVPIGAPVTTRLK